MKRREREEKNEMKTKKSDINLIGVHFVSYDIRFYGEWECLKPWDYKGKRWLCKNAEHENKVIPYGFIMTCERF